MSTRPIFNASMMGLSLAIHIAASALVLGIGKPPPLPPEPRAAVSLGGETFEVAETEPESMAPSTPASIPSPARPSHARGTRGRDAVQPGAARASESSAPSPEAASPPLFGAVGERGVFDVATAFTRAFPQAASADPAWTHVPLGSAGSADVSLEIDDTGHLVDTRVAGTPSPALREGIRRTVVLIRARSFVSSAAVTRLHITGTVTPDVVHDGLHGDVFAIGGSFAGREGSAFFALSIGRRVDLNIVRK